MEAKKGRPQRGKERSGNTAIVNDVVCLFYLKGNCERGKKCGFPHTSPQEEERQRRLRREEFKKEGKGLWARFKVNALSSGDRDRPLTGNVSSLNPFLHFSGSAMDDLPLEIIFYIFSFLRFTDLLWRAALVSSEWVGWAHDSMLWENLYRITWKKTYTKEKKKHTEVNNHSPRRI